MTARWIGIDHAIRAADAHSEAELERLLARKHRQNPLPPVPKTARKATHGAGNMKGCRCAECYVAGRTRNPEEWRRALEEGREARQRENAVRRQVKAIADGKEA